MGVNRLRWSFCVSLHTTCADEPEWPMGGSSTRKPGGIEATLNAEKGPDMDARVACGVLPYAEAPPDAAPLPDMMAATDGDGVGVPDATNNCIETANPDQVDTVVLNLRILGQCLTAGGTTVDDEHTLKNKITVGAGLGGCYVGTEADDTQYVCELLCGHECRAHDGRRNSAEQTLIWRMPGETAVRAGEVMPNPMYTGGPKIWQNSFEPEGRGDIVCAC